MFVPIHTRHSHPYSSPTAYHFYQRPTNNPRYNPTPRGFGALLSPPTATTASSLLSDLEDLWPLVPFFYRETPTQGHPGQQEEGEDGGQVAITKKNTDVPDAKAQEEGEAEDEQAMKQILLYRNRNSRVAEYKDKYVFTFDLPGVKRQDLTVELLTDNGVLHIAGRRRVGNNGNGNNGNEGKFSMRYGIDTDMVDGDNVGATLEDGVLTVTLPKKPVPEPQEVKVVAEDPPATMGEEKEGKDKNETPVAQGLRLELDVPGVKLANLQVQYVPKDSTLVVQGKRGDRKFRRAFVLKNCGRDFDLVQLKGFLMDGVLTVVAPPSSERLASAAADGERAAVPNVKKIPVGQKEREDGGQEAPTTSKKIEKVVVETADDEDE